MFQILDFVLLGIVLVSGLLAMARGFMRELFSLATWVAAAFAAKYAVENRQIMEAVAKYFDPTKPILAQVAVGAAAFILVFILLSVISIRIADRVVDGRVGPLDRSLGFLYGAARGLVLVAVCYIVYGWLVPNDKQEDWIRNAATLPVITRVSESIKSYLPQKMRDFLSNSDVKSNGIDAAPNKAAAAPPKDTIYPAGQQQGLGNLSKNVTGQDQKKP